MSDAVAESPFFDTIRDDIDNTATDDYIVLTRRTYVSPVLQQDVTLVAPPEVRLYADPVNSAQTYQVHVNVLDGLTASSNPIVSQAHACAWEEETKPAIFNGTAFEGGLRLHKFHSGDRIGIELVTVATEAFWTTHSGLPMLPALGDFEVDVYMQLTDSKQTSVKLELDPTDDGSAIFATPGGLGIEEVEGEQVAVESTPATPVTSPDTPLTLDYALSPNFTNRDDWRIWSTQVSFTCTGGAGGVSCPADTLLVEDGINQSFTFTATDSVGGVDTVTISNINIDQTPPQLTTTLPESQTFCSGAATQLNFSSSDALSGLDRSAATFNGQPVESGAMVNLVEGANVLSVEAVDIANNSVTNQATLLVNYNTTLEFPTDGGQVNPLLPLAFAFQVNDTCAAQGWYNGAAGTLWLTSPSGVEQPAEWYGLPTGNSFVLNSLTGWYEFDADLTGLAAGTWTARADLDDGTSRSVTFVIPAAGPNVQDALTLPTFDCVVDLARHGRYLGGCR